MSARTGLLLGGVLAWAALVVGVPGVGPQRVVLLNVSYDPTRELWRELNAAFAESHERETGKSIGLKMSHGGSGSQARSVIDGLPADVVTLALWTDIEGISKKGLIAKGWEDRLPNKSLPYTSTIVFVVRKGSAKPIRDWPDLLAPGVEVVTPNPGTSGNGKMVFLSAWAAAKHRAGGDDAAGRAFVRAMYRDHAANLDSSARAATTRFMQQRQGDVHLTWENEAWVEVRESKHLARTPGEELQIVYPPVSLRAEPYVAVVDDNVDRFNHTRPEAEAYLKFLYTPEAQEIIARNYYRPTDPATMERHRDKFPPMTLLTIRDVAAGWAAAQERFFTKGGEFDKIFSTKAGQ